MHDHSKATHLTGASLAVSSSTTEKALDSLNTLSVIRTHLTPPEAAAYLRTTRHVLANWRSRGVGPRYAKLGSKVLYRLTDLEKYVAERIIETVESVGA